MGTAFEQLIQRSQSGFFHAKHDRLCNSTADSRLGAVFQTNSWFKTAKSLEAFAIVIPGKSTANGSSHTTRSFGRKGNRDNLHRKQHWRRCDSVGETLYTAVSFEVAGNTTDSSTLSTSSNRSVQPKLESRCNEIEIKVVEAVEKAENAAVVVPEIVNSLNYLRPGTLQEAAEAPPTLQEDGDLRIRDHGTADNSFSKPRLFKTSASTTPQPIDGHGEPGKGMLEQMRDIIMFAGPALGIWLSGPVMSLIDTAVVGNSSSLELAALGPGTVLCDQLCYVFMFLSVATSNLIATSLANKDISTSAQHLSRLLFVALACGCGMLLFTSFLATPLLQAFVGAKNAALVPAAQSYVQIRGLAWPAVLVGMVSQSASLGMKDSWGPLKVLAVASLTNCLGDIVLCTGLGYGIAGAAWATIISQYIAGFLMLRSLNRKGFNVLTVLVPSSKELAHMVELAAPVLLTMLSKVAFYTVITYLTTSLGAISLAAHQVMIGIFCICTVAGEPLAQTAQSFMPALIQGSNRNFRKAHMLLRSLLLIGAISGLFLGCIAISIPWFFPQVFTRDTAIISQMQAITLPFLCSLVILPPALSLEGTLLAGRDYKYLGFSMVSCFIGGSVVLLTSNRLGFGLQGSWWVLLCFQMARFAQAFVRLRSAKSVLGETHFSFSKQPSTALKEA